MRRSFLVAVACAVISVQAASAADMPTKAPAHAPAIWNWTGFYLGGQAGGGWSSSTQTNVDGTGAFLAGTVQPPISSSGFLGGVYGGYNYQFSPSFLVGIDADYSWADLTGSSTVPANTGAALSNAFSIKVKSLATVTARLGYIFNNNWMLFGKAGWAWSDWDANSVTTRTTTGAVTSSGTSSPNRNGLILGTGLEWAFAEHWSAKLEYDYVHFNTVSYNSTDTSAGGTVSSPARSQTSYMNIVKVGAAYRF
jgi:outer membrane immunogenic protein